MCTNSFKHKRHEYHVTCMDTTSGIPDLPQMWSSKQRTTSGSHKLYSFTSFDSPRYCIEGVSLPSTIGISVNFVAYMLPAPTSHILRSHSHAITRGRPAPMCSTSKSSLRNQILAYSYFVSSQCSQGGAEVGSPTPVSIRGGSMMATSPPFMLMSAILGS